MLSNIILKIISQYTNKLVGSFVTAKFPDWLYILFIIREKAIEIKLGSWSDICYYYNIKAEAIIFFDSYSSNNWKDMRGSGSLICLIKGFCKCNHYSYSYKIIQTHTHIYIYISKNKI